MAHGLDDASAYGLGTVALALLVDNMPQRATLVNLNCPRSRHMLLCPRIQSDRVVALPCRATARIPQPCLSGSSYPARGGRIAWTILHHRATCGRIECKRPDTCVRPPAPDGAHRLEQRQAGIAVMRASIIGLVFLLVAGLGWGNGRPAWADTLDDLVSQMDKAEVANSLAASWLYNLATINLLVTVADRAGMREQLVPLMEMALDLFGEEQVGLDDKGEAMLAALRGVLEDAVEREQQR